MRCPPLSIILSGLAASFGFELRDVADGNFARLHLLRNAPDQVDVEQPVFEGGALDLDIVGEIESPFERARRDTLIQVLGVTLFLLPAGDRELAGFRVMVISSRENPATAMLIWNWSSPLRTIS